MLTLFIFNTELTHLGSEASIYTFYESIKFILKSSEFSVNTEQSKLFVNVTTLMNKRLKF